MIDLIYNKGVNVNTPQSNVFIYCWENLINQKKYVGQTKQGKKRLSDEKCLHNVSGAFQEALIKYGQINFKCYVLEYCSVDELDIKERYWINNQKSHYSQHGYNLTWGGQNASKVVFYSQQTNKIYETLNEVEEDEYDFIYKYDLLSRSIQEQIKPFYAFDKNGVLLKRFISLNDALKFCSGLDVDNIRKNLNGQLKSAYGYIWSYEKIVNTYKSKNWKSIAQYDLNGDLVEIFNTIRDAAKNINDTDKNLWGALNRPEVKQLKGFMWKYVDENFELKIKSYLDQIPFKIIQYDLKHNKINEYASIEEASRVSGDSRTRISLACNGHIPHTRKHIWEKYFNKEVE